MKGRIPVVLLLTALPACAGSEPEPPVEEPSAPEGVYGRAPSAAGGSPSVVTLSAPGQAGSLGGDGTPVIDQLGLVFSPTRVLLRVGQPIAFTNSESIGHNVHVREWDTNATVINRDTDPTQRIEHVFEEAGAYVVGCDVHPGMRAVIYVTSAAYGTFASEGGDFVVPDVPPGSYELSVWSADPDLRSSRALEVTGPATEVTLTP